MFGYGFNRSDMIYFVYIILPILVISLFVSMRVKLIYLKYSKISNAKGLTGAVAARDILDSYGLYSVGIEMIGGSLTDHFDPISNVVRLSIKNYSGSSIAAIGVVAHEVGHAVQYAKRYLPIRIRSAMVPATRFGSAISMPLFVAGIFLSNPKLSYLGLALFSIVSIFSLITLPVEFDASFRAIKILEGKNILSSLELKGVKKVLWAAGMTYIVSFVMSLAQFFRLFLLINSKDED